MKKVCMFHFPRMENFHDYSIDCLDPAPYFQQAKSLWGSVMLTRKLAEAKWIDQMYRERNPSYMRFLSDFKDKFKDADLIVAATYNPVHPEVLVRDFRSSVKILGFTDDPHSSYLRGIPYLWAFDGAFYISPSYSDQVLFKDALERWGCKHSYWWPLVWPAGWGGKSGAGRENVWPLAVPRSEALRRDDRFFRERDIDLIYVGGYYGPKVDRLVQLRKRFGSRLKIYGKWRLGGYRGVARCLLGQPPLWTRVRAISDQERSRLYCRTKIGINMHLSETPTETGNMRMYEAPAHGMMLLCDKAGLNAHERIFEPGKEAVFYDSVDDMIAKIEYYLQHDGEREQIARAGFARAHRDYDGETNFKSFLDWAIGLRNGEP